MVPALPPLHRPMQLEGHTRPRRRLIALTPLIDVVFILLLFFMLASSLGRYQGIPLNTPSVSSAPAQSDENLVRIAIAGDGSLRLDGETFELEALIERLDTRRAETSNLRVQLDPEDSVSLQRLLSIADALSAAGIQTLGLR